MVCSAIRPLAVSPIARIETRLSELEDTYQCVHVMGDSLIKIVASNKTICISTKEAPMKLERKIERAI